MFSGIITHLGKLDGKNGSVFSFRVDKSLTDALQQGSSISVNGVCLTVLDRQNGVFTVEIMPETEERTMFGRLRANDIVNLELPMTPSSLISGHLAQGHVDGIGILEEIETKGNSRILKISLPPGLKKYVVGKGSICVNGISLTVIEAAKNYFTVGIIPYTWQNTMLHKVKIGDPLNLEVDVIAKYVEKLVKKTR